MRFALSAAAALVAFVSSAVAQNPDFNPVYKPASGEEVAAGSTYKIEWAAPEKYAGVTIKIALIGGDTQNTQVPLLDIASGVPNADNAYTWNIPADIGGKKFYGLVLTSEANAADWQYSNPFVITAGEDSGSDAPDYGTGSTTVITTSVGTATITLSAASTTAEPTTEVAVNTTTSCIETTTELPKPTYSVVVPVHNTTSVVAVPTTHTTLVVASSTVAIVEQPTESVPVTVPESGAVGQAQAGLLAVFGAVAFAALL